MTGGTAAILGSVGGNLAAGMTGGMAFAYDAGDGFKEQVNLDSVPIQRLASHHWEGVLHKLIVEHEAETGSRHAAAILAHPLSDAAEAEAAQRA